MKYNLEGVKYLVYYIRHYTWGGKRRFIKTYKTDCGMKRLLKELLNDVNKKGQVTTIHTFRIVESAYDKMDLMVMLNKLNREEVKKHVTQ